MFRAIAFLVVSIFGEDALDLVLFVLLMAGILAIGVFVGPNVSYVLAAVLALGYAWLLFTFRAKAVRWMEDEPFLSSSDKTDPSEND